MRVHAVLAFFFLLAAAGQCLARERCSESHVDYGWETLGEVDFKQGLRFVMCPQVKGERIRRAEFGKLENTQVLDSARMSVRFGAFRKGVDIKCNRGGKRLEQSTYHTFLQEIIVTFAGSEMIACRAVSKSFITDERHATWGDDPYKIEEASCKEFQKIARASCQN